MRISSALFGCALVLVSTGAALALDPCAATPAASSDDLARYSRSPEALLQAPDGMADDAKIGLISSRVRNVVASNPDSISALAPFLKVAAGGDASALGIGLGAAAQICSRRNPAAAQEIQKAVLEANNNDVSRVFAGIIGDQPVLAVTTAATAPVAGDTNIGGGPHRGTNPVTIGFRSGAVPEGSASAFGSPSSRSSSRLFSSVSGFR